MKSYRIILSVAAMCLAVSCGKTVIKGNLKDAPDSRIVVKILDVNRFHEVDTVKTDSHGNFSYNLDVEKGQPDFIYLFYNGHRFASLLVANGDVITVKSDTLGKESKVTGSKECEKLQEVERDYSKFTSAISALADKYVETEEERYQIAISKTYVNYYRGRVAYLLNNPKSMTTIPVLYQELDKGLPVFNRPTDAMHFRRAADSLKTVYPESKYVKALQKEAEKKMNALALSKRLESAGEVGFIDIELPDINGKSVKLSEVDSKLTMVYFWSTRDGQETFSLDHLKPVYDKYHGKGLEIFAVALDADKTEWAKVVRAQNLPWINVCDTRAGRSPYLGLYAVNQVPTVAFIFNDALDAVPEGLDAASLEKYVASKLK